MDPGENVVTAARRMGLLGRDPPTDLDLGRDCTGDRSPRPRPPGGRQDDAAVPLPDDEGGATTVHIGPRP